MNMWRSILPQLLVLLCHVVVLNSEKILGEENEEFDFDGLPGAMHEFKVYIRGGTEDCFFQPVETGARFHVNFEVLDSDKKVDFVIRNHLWQSIESQAFTKSGQYNMESSPGDTFAVCIDNVYNRMTAILVYIYMVTFEMQEWVQYQEELGQINVLATNFSTSLTGVQESVAAMRTSQAKARMNVIKDWYLVTGNNSYINIWSIVQCVVIVTAAIIQVYSVRRLFRSTNVTPTTSKPRA